MMRVKKEELRRIREEKGMSKKQTSLKAGLPPASVWKIEKGCSTYTHDIRAMAIAKALGCRVEDIFEKV